MSFEMISPVKASLNAAPIRRQIERGLFRSLMELQRAVYQKRNEAILIQPEEVLQNISVSSS